ncbi:MAG TPA: methionyl-tRNA formyltransferase, partial [Blastocatellia bacterium]|nr:methionyl-tRNA formyltransferase [Blastocatellia bacterium]
ELAERLAQLGAELLSETLPRIERGEIEPIPQDHSEASYAPMLKREDGLIDWRMTAREIANRVRAFQPWPGSYTEFRKKRLTIWRAREENTTSTESAEPGTVLAIDETGIVIACEGSTALRIEEVQIEGKRRVTGREFANGARLSPGNLLNQ